MAGAAPDVELSRFLESCPEKIRDKLGKWNIITGERAAAGKTLAAHIKDWRLELEARGNTAKHVVETVTKATVVCNKCGWRMLSDISTSSLVLQLQIDVTVVLDIAFDEDSNRTRKGDGAENLSTIRRIALNLLRDCKMKCGVKEKRILANADCGIREKILKI